MYVFSDEKSSPTPLSSSSTFRRKPISINSERKKSSNKTKKTLSFSMHRSLMYRITRVEDRFSIVWSPNSNTAGTTPGLLNTLSSNRSL